MEKTENYKKPTAKELKNLKKDYFYALNYAWPRKVIVYNEKSEIVKELTDRPAMHQFWADIAERYGIKYATTFGAYGIYGDLYKNGYIYALDEKIQMVKSSN